MKIFGIIAGTVNSLVNLGVTEGSVCPFYGKLNILVPERIQNAFKEFWKKYDARYDKDKIPSVMTGNTIIKTLKEEESVTFSSLLLPLMLSPLQQTRSDCYFDEVCLTGDVEVTGDNKLAVKPVIAIENKYSAYCKSISNEENARAFVYVADEDIVLHTFKSVVPIRIHSGALLEDVITKLLAYNYYSMNNFYSYISAVSQKLQEVESNSVKTTLILTGYGTDLHSNMYIGPAFNFFNTMVSENKELDVRICSTLPLTNEELVADGVKEEVSRKWFLGKEKKITDKEVREKNSQLLSTQNRVTDLVEGLKKQVFFQQKKNKKLKIKIVTDFSFDDDRIDILETEKGSKKTGSVLIVEKKESKLCFWTTEAGFYYKEMKKAEDEFPEEIKKVLDIFNKKEPALEWMQYNIQQLNEAKELLQINVVPSNEDKEKLRKILSVPPRISLCGFPASGKSTLNHLLAEIFNAEVIESDDFINNRCFSDDCKREGDLTREEFENMPYGKERMMEIRNMAVEICIKKAVTTNKLLDLGGKEFICDNTKFVLREYNYTSVFIDFSDNRNEAYEKYLGIFKKDENQADESKRKNLFDLKKECKGTNNEEFAKKLQEKIFDKRYDFYREADLTVIREDNDSPETLLWKILKAFISDQLEKYKAIGGVYD